MDAVRQNSDTRGMADVLLNCLVYSLPLVSAGYLVAGVYLVRRTADGSMTSFAWVMAAAAVYSFGYFLELHSPSLELMLPVRNFELLGAILLPAVGLGFVGDLTNRAWPRPLILGAFVVAVVLWALLVSNPVHGLFYGHVEVLTGRFSIPFTAKGPAYFVFLGTVAVFLVLSTLRLVQAARFASDARSRRSLRITLAAFQLPWIGVVLILFGLDHDVDPIPPAILLTCLVFLVNALRNDMFQVEVRRWDSLFQGIDEPAFLVDSTHTVVQVNAATRRLWAEAPPVPEEREFHLEGPDGERWFEVSRNPYGSRGTLVSFLLVDITDRRRAETELRRLLAEKELLLREVHHRIKNNMSNVIGMLALQSMALADSAARSALDDAAVRVQSMMVLYDKLYQGTNFQEVSTAEYFPALIREILAHFSPAAMVDCDPQIDDFPLPHRQVEPLGIILNELLTNAMKYAFVGRDQGRLTVVLQRHNGQVKLQVSDDGVGSNPARASDRPAGFGMTMVTTLSDHLDGTLEITREGGTTVTLTFPQ